MHDAQNNRATAWGNPGAANDRAAMPQSRISASKPLLSKILLFLLPKSVLLRDIRLPFPLQSKESGVRPSDLEFDGGQEKRQVCYIGRR